MAFATIRTLRLRPSPRRSQTFLADTSMRSLHTHRQTASKVVSLSEINDRCAIGYMTCGAAAVRRATCPAALTPEWAAALPEGVWERQRAQREAAVAQQPEPPEPPPD